MPGPAQASQATRWPDAATEALAGDYGGAVAAWKANVRPVTLSWGVMWCDKHLAPLKSDWPKGATQAMLGLFNAAAANDDILRRSGGKVENLPLVLNSIKPVCCFLGDAIANEVIRLALLGQVYGKPANDPS